MTRNDDDSGMARQPTGSPLYYGWIVLAGCTVLSVMSGMFFYARGIFLPQLSSDLGVGRLQISLAFTGAQVIGSLAAPLIGMILDRYSPRIVLLVGAIMLAASYVLTALSHSLLAVYLVFGLLTGIGWVTISNFGSSRILVEWFERRLGFALSIDALGASIAGVIVAPVATFLIARSGWRWAYADLGIVTLAIALPVLLFVIRSRPAAGELAVRDGSRDRGPALAMTPWTFRQAVGDRGFWGITITFGLMACVWSGINLHLFGHLSERGLTAWEGAEVLSVEAAAAAIGKPLVGLLSDAIGVRRATYVATALQLVGVVMLARANGAVAALASGLIYGLGLSGLVGLQGLAVARIFGRRSYGFASGWLRTATLPFTLIGSPFAGLVYDRFGNYQPAFWGYAVLLLLIFPATRLLDPHPREHDAAAAAGEVP